jgi:hypothetical protein
MGSWSLKSEDQPFLLYMVYSPGFGQGKTAVMRMIMYSKSGLSILQLGQKSVTWLTTSLYAVTFVKFCAMTDINNKY